MMKRRLFLVHGPVLALLAGFLLFSAGCAAVKPHPTDQPEERKWTPSDVSTQLGDADPWEGFNRSMFAVNKFGMLYIVRPVGWVYGSILPRPAIKHIGMASENLAFPARMFSAMCQNKWQDSGVVFLRFLTNTTIGIAGLFDPADAWFDLYPRDDTFGQAFESWGCGPGYTLVLPLCSGTNVRDSVGALFDMVFDIKTYIPYGASTFAGVNKAVDSYRPYKRLITANQDPYQLYKEFDIMNRRLQQQDWALKMRIAAAEAKEKSAQNPPSPPAPTPLNPRPASIHAKIIHLEDYRPENAYSDTVRSVMFKPQSDDTSFWTQLSPWNSDFTEQAETREIPAARKDADPLEYSFWRAPRKDQYNSAPLVFVLPGIGSHHTNPTAVAFAELLNHQGYAVVVLSNAFCWDFFNSRHTGVLPGYTPVDAGLVRNAMRSVLRDLGEGKESKRFKPESIDVVGYSLGGLHALHIAAMEEKKNLLNLNRIVAINPPVDMLNALHAVDQNSGVAKGWTQEKMLEVFPDAFGKAMAAMSTTQPYVNPMLVLGNAGLDDPPRVSCYNYRTHLSEEQSKILVSMAFRYTLRDVMAQAIRDKRISAPPNMGYAWSDRTRLYLELDRISFHEYMRNYLLPQLGTKDGKALTIDALRKRTGLRAVESTLKTNPNVRVMHNLDDFLLTRQDRVFLDKTVKDRLTWFDQGGAPRQSLLRRLPSRTAAQSARRVIGQCRLFLLSVVFSTHPIRGRAALSHLFSREGDAARRGEPQIIVARLSLGSCCVPRPCGLDSRDYCPEHFPSCIW